MLRKLACMAAISTAWWLSTAAALGLGDIEVKSRLNQKFSASIPLIAASTEAAEGLQISLAGNDDYARAGVERSEFVSTLQFEVKLDGAVPRIEVSSKQIARDPYMVFLIDVRNQRTRLLREYTVLLDPPATEKSPAAASVVTNNAAQFFEAPGDQPATPAKPPVAAAPPPAAAETPRVEASEQMPAPAVTTAEGQYGPVQPGETLWSIASQLRAAPSVSMDQMMLALHSANPAAFAGGSINGLLKGAVLRVPSAEEQRAVPVEEARARVAQLRGVPVAEPPARPAPTPPPAVAQPPPQAVEPPPRPAPTPPPPPPTPRPAPAEPSVVPTPEAMSPPPAEPAPQVSETPPEPAVTPPVPEEPAVQEPEPELEPETATPPPPVAAPPVRVAQEQGLPMELLLAALVFVLVALGGGYYLYRRRKGGGELTSSLSRRPVVPPLEEQAPPAPVVASRLSAPQATRDELERLDETLGDERADLGMPLEPPPAPRAEPPRLDETLGMTRQLPDTGQTTQFRVDPNATQVVEPVSAATAKLAEKVDFDVTGQFESDTVSINLDTNDPVAEADFHLAYGLYDEAALLLQQAAEKDPGNAAVRVKLAEVYFAAGKAAEFEQTAEPLKNELPAVEWQKLAILGQQLCPDSPVFQDVGGGDLGAAVDLNFDEPAAETPAAPAPAAPPPAKGGEGGSVLDFKLEDFELPSAPEPATKDKPASMPGSSVLEFNLDVPEIKSGAAGGKPESAPKAQKAPEPEEPKLELDLEAFDLGTPDLPPPPPPAKPKPATGDGEMKLEDFDVAADSAAIGADDAAGTKLDLARAYLDMGDKDMTKSLLEEVLVQGNAQQKQEAQALMGRLN